MIRLMCLNFQRFWHSIKDYLVIEHTLNNLFKVGSAVNAGSVFAAADKCFEMSGEKGAGFLVKLQILPK